MALRILLQHLDKFPVKVETKGGKGVLNMPIDLAKLSIDEQTLLKTAALLDPGFAKQYMLPLPLSVDVSQAIVGLDFIPKSEIERVLLAGGTFLQKFSPESLTGPPIDELDTDQSELSLSLSGLPGQAQSILSSVRNSLRENGIFLYMIQVLEDDNNFLGLRYWGNYQVKVYMHSPPTTGVGYGFLIPILIAVVVLAILAAVTVNTWQYRVMKRDEVVLTALNGAVDTTKALQESVNAMPPGPEKTAAQVQANKAKAALLQAQVGLVTEEPAKPKTDMWGTIKTITIVAGISLVFVALLNSGILSSAAKAIPQRA